MHDVVRDLLSFFSHYFSGFSDPLSAYTNTRAFLDYRVMGFRECAAEVARYMANVEGLDMKDPLRMRMLSHLENYLAQRELAINAAVAASAQMGVPKVPSPTAAGIAIHPTPGPFIPIQTQHSPTSPPAASLTDCIPLSVALPTPVISFANTATVPVFGATPIASLGSLPTATIPIATTTKIDQSVTVTKIEQPSSPIKTIKTLTSTKMPFRPWADDETDD